MSRAGAVCQRSVATHVWVSWERCGGEGAGGGVGRVRKELAKSMEAPLKSSSMVKRRGKFMKLIFREPLFRRSSRTSLTAVLQSRLAPMCRQAFFFFLIIVNVMQVPGELSETKQNHDKAL